MFFLSIIYRCNAHNTLQFLRTIQTKSILWLLGTTQGPFVDGVDQDQTAQNVQSDLCSTLTDEDILFLRKLTLREQQLVFHIGFKAYCLIFKVAYSQNSHCKCMR